MFDIDNTKYVEGRAAYASGHDLFAVLGVLAAEYKAAEDDKTKDWQARERNGQSFVLGFVDGALGDLRKLAAGRGGARA